MIRTHNRPSPLPLLFTLYFCQGLPFGFQATALPVLLRQQGFSLAAIGGAGLLSLPWALKLLWAPFLDRYRLPFAGRRTGWIFLLQGLLILTALFAWQASMQESPWPLFAALFLMNLACATQDIAVDALTVASLSKGQLGYGNAAQVGGFKCGMVMGGGVLMWAASHLGWPFLFGAFPLLLALPLPLLLLFREPESGDPTKKADTVKTIIRSGVSLIAKKELRPLILFVLFYKTGEAMTDVMFKPLLVDRGFSTATIGLWVGSVGMAASIAGTLAGGFFVKQLGLHRALTLTLSFRLIPLGAMAGFVHTGGGELALATLTFFEHLAGGMLTTVCFSSMMAVVNKRLGATHYTALATLEVIGKSPSVWLAGPLAQSLGYLPLFVLGATLSAAVMLLLPRLKPIFSDPALTQGPKESP